MMQTNVHRFVAPLSGALALTLSSLPIAAEPITASDLSKLKSIASVEVAPDGTFAVFGVREIAETKGDKTSFRTHLWRINLQAPNAKPVALTSGERGASSAVISPDGSTLAFTRPGEGEEPKSQVWLMPLDGPGEARQLTTLENGAGSPRWFPDGQSLLVSSSTPFDEIEGALPWDDERPMRQWGDTKTDDENADEDGAEKKGQGKDKGPKGKPDGTRDEVRQWLAANAKDADPSVLNSLRFQGEMSLRGESRASHLYRVDSQTGEAEQLTEGFYSSRGAQVSPDGERIAFSSGPRIDTHPDRILRGAVFMMDADGSNQRAVLDDDAWTYGSARFSHDGAFLYFTMSETEDRWGRQSKLARASLHSDGSLGTIERIASSWPSGIQGFDVSESGVFFRSPWQGGAALLWWSPDYAADDVRALSQSPRGVYAFDASDGIVVAGVTSVDRPSRLMVGDLSVDDGALHEVFDPNADLLEDKVLSMPTEHWITRDDGTKVQYWVMPPTNSKPGEKYPTVLEIHGGPSAMWGPGESSMWHEFQLLCSWGYGVVYSNPRGSSGYGYEFQSANYRDWGFGPTGDVLECLDDAGDRYEWIDEDRLFVTGGSYAGYLTAFIVGNDHRFKAAVAQRGVYDLETFFGEGNAWILVPWAFGGYPWEQEVMEVLDRESPFTYVHQIETPFLIMHSSQDLRTGVTQSEMMYRALKAMEKDVEYVRYPNQGHNLSRGGNAKLRMDRLLRIIEFFERYAENDRPAPVVESEEEENAEDSE